MATREGSNSCVPGWQSHCVQSLDSWSWVSALRSLCGDSIGLCWCPCQMARGSCSMSARCGATSGLVTAAMIMSLPGGGRRAAQRLPRPASRRAARSGRGAQIPTPQSGRGQGPGGPGRERRGAILQRQGVRERAVGGERVTRRSRHRSQQRPRNRLSRCVDPLGREAQ